MDFIAGVPFEDLPPEIQEFIRTQQEELKRRHDMHHMAIESSRHRMLNFLEDMNEEQLNCVRGLIQLVMEDHSVAGFYMGFTAQLMTKFGYCAICAEKHDDPRDHKDELLKDASPEEPEAYEEPDQRAIKKLFEKFNLNRDLTCKGCGTQYQSLKDRMLREPGPAGCDNCKQTTKWGGTEPTYDPDLKDH